MQGLHLTADLYACRCDRAWLTDSTRLRDWCLRSVQAAGFDPIGDVFAAAGSGITGTVLLTQSHLCLHTWPQHKGVTADVYVSNEDGSQAAQARALMDALVGLFAPEWTEQRSLDRGDGE